MTPADLGGAGFGPVEHAIDRERIAGFVQATGDDARRWLGVAPPGYGAALLFAVAGPFLGDPRIREYTRTLIHVDQQFRYERPLTAGAYSVSGTVDRVRERGGAWFVTFRAVAECEEGPAVVATSTFLMSNQPAGEPGEDRVEPPARDRGESQRAASTSGGVAIEPLPKSASRLDLVRYAAATGDFNPIHWDHASARAAGLDGIVVHGLLMHAWLSQLATTVARGSVPIAAIKSRFRAALAPAAAAVAAGEAVKANGPSADLRLRLSSGGTDMVTATATVRVGEE